MKNIMVCMLLNFVRMGVHIKMGTKRIRLITEKKNLENIYTLINKGYMDFHREDYNNLRTYFREIIIENLKED